MINWLVETKKKYQFSGWLQYMITFIQATIIMMLAGILALLNFTSIASAIALLALILVLLGLLDIVTIKYGYSFKESNHLQEKELTAHEAILKRKSCRSFQQGKMSTEHLQRVMDQVEQITKNNHTSSKGIRYEYISAPLTVWPVVNASEFLVAIGPKAYKRQTIVEVGRLLQHIVIQLTRLGIATCWIGPGADQSSLMQHLGDKLKEDEDHVICICAIGYRSKRIPLFLRLMKRIQNTRKTNENLFYDQPDLSKSCDLDVPLLTSYTQAFEACRYAPSAFNGQPTRAVVNTNKEGIHAIDFYTVKKSKYYSPIAAGIWCANWELAMIELGKTGEFEYNNTLVHDDSSLPTYEMSWVNS
jgi:nitroreductase